MITIARCLRFGVGLAIALAAAACGSKFSPPLTAGASGAPSEVHNSERVLNLYNWAGYMDPAVIRAFEVEYGIKVNSDAYDSNEVLEAKLLTGRTNYDVVVPSAYFIERQIKAGVYRKLEKAQLPNLGNLDPDVARGLASYDPGNQYAVGYMWLSTTGIGYEVASIRARMADAPVDSWRMLFDPQLLAKFADCGVAVLDSPVNVVSAALAFLGKDPNSESLADLQTVEQLLLSVRPYIRYVDSLRLADDLANGEVCLSLDWSGDVTLARDSALQSHTRAQVAYSIPREGTVSNFDVLAIPADAPHADNAHLFINYLLRPEVAAKNSNATKYANSVAGSAPLLSPAVRDDPGIYPPAEVRARLVPSRARSPAYMRLLMRTWTRFKAGRRV